jgi:uncharacterized protein YaiI (UPF0178 family)
MGKWMHLIYVDADGCPVKDEVYRVADRYGLKVRLVANHWIRAPESPMIEKIVVGEGLDRADDWIAERAGQGDIVVTSDVPLASRCVKAGAKVIGGNGKLFSEASIGQDLAMRNLMTSLRETGEVRGGGRPFSKRDRSNFLQELDKAVNAVLRTYRT